MRGKPLIVTGATGTLGQAFARLCGHRGLTYRLTGREQMDITKRETIERFLDEQRPWAVINAAGFVRVDEAKERADECFLVNSTGPELLAAACRERGIRFVTFSSDLVFDGQLGRPYREPDPTAPACTYGESKAEAEQRVLALDEEALIVRTSAFFGPWDRYNFVWSVIDRLARGEEVEANAGEVVTPTYVPDLVHSTLDLLLDGEGGVWHLANQGSTSWHELACEVADRRGLPVRKIRDSGGRKADTSLTSDRGLLLRPLSQALDDYLISAENLPAA
jgi:dTDP-4-dehydrorhamnose reductase